MKYVVPKIGVMPAIGLGTWRLSGSGCVEAVKMALRLGYRHIDTADMYGNHVEVGKGIKGFPREEIFLVSKIIYENLQPKKVEVACRRILQELDTPYLDLLLIHWPSKEVSSEHTLEAMMRLMELDLVRHLGVSNFMISHLQEIEKRHFPIIANQIELHPYLQEVALTDYCQKRGIIVTAYRPIQKGEVEKDKLLKGMALKHGKTPVQITLRWLFQRGIVSIPKASSEEHLRHNLEIFDFVLSEEDMEAIATLDAGKRYVV